MRAGTQTLIQALQALPWTGRDNEDDDTTGESDSDEPRPKRKQISALMRNLQHIS